MIVTPWFGKHLDLVKVWDVLDSDFISNGHSAYQFPWRDPSMSAKENLCLYKLTGFVLGLTQPGASNPSMLGSIRGQQEPEKACIYHFHSSHSISKWVIITNPTHLPNVGTWTQTENSKQNFFPEIYHSQCNGFSSERTHMFSSNPGDKETVWLSFREDQKTEVGHMTDTYPWSWIHFNGSEHHIQCYIQVSKKQSPRTTQGWETCFVAHNSPVVVEPPTPQTHAALREKGRED